MADYEYDTLKPLGSVLVNPYSIRNKKQKQSELLEKDKILQVAEGAFICSSRALESTAMVEWLAGNRLKTIIQPVSIDDCRVYGRWGLQRISFTDRKTTILFKLANETVRI